VTDRRNSHKDFPFAWLCRRCRVHTDADFSNRDSATAEAERHSAHDHPAQHPRYLVIEEFARCQWKPRLLSRICGQRASWTHAPGTDKHLCEGHRAEV